MSPTSKKLVGGVLALLFVISFVQTQAIVKIAKGLEANKNIAAVSAEDQAAQVSSASNCIQILPASNNRTTFIDADDYPVLPDFHTFVIGAIIKNNCNTGISIILDANIAQDPANSVAMAKLEDFPNIADPTLASNFTMMGPIPSYPPNIYSIYPVDVVIPASNISGVLSTFGGDIGISNIPANSQREFTITSDVVANWDNIHHYTRLSFKKLRWFKTSSYNDLMLSTNEVKTFVLPANDSKTFTSSYANFNDPNDGSDMQNTNTKSQKAAEDILNAARKMEVK